MNLVNFIESCEGFIYDFYFLIKKKICFEYKIEFLKFIRLFLLKYCFDGEKNSFNYEISLNLLFFTLLKTFVSFELVKSTRFSAPHKRKLKFYKLLNL